MATPHYEIFIRNGKFDVVGVITQYSKLEFRLVYNGVGGFILEMNSNTREARLMKSLFRAQVGAYSGIIVTRNGRIVFSGVTRGFEQTGDYTGREDQENIMFFGMDDTGLLSMRILMVPVFGSDPQVFTSPSNQNWDIWTFPLAPKLRTVSTVIYTTVANNISFQAPQYRQIKELYVQKPAALGPNVTVRGRYQNLLGKCQDLSFFPGDKDYMRTHPSYTGVQFRILQLETPIYVYTSGPNINTPVPLNIPPPTNSQLKKVQFSINLPKDKRNSVVFSKGFKNLGSFRYKLQGPKSTYVILGGQNNESTLKNPAHDPNPITLPDESPRTRWFFHAAADSGKINLVSRYGLWETFLDRRDIQYGQAPQSPVGTPAPKVVSDPYPRLEDDTYDPQPVAPKAIDNYNNMKAEAIQAMQTELVEKRELLEIEITAINISPTRWPDDYNIGDVATVVIPGEEDSPFSAKVKELTVTLTQEEGEVVTPIIGTETIPNGRDIFSQIISVDKKTNFLEELR